MEESPDPPSDRCTDCSQGLGLCWVLPSLPKGCLTGARAAAWSCGAAEEPPKQAAAPLGHQGGCVQMQCGSRCTAAGSPSPDVRLLSAFWALQVLH